MFMPNRINVSGDSDEADSIFQVPESPWKGTNFDERWREARSTFPKLAGETDTQFSEDETSCGSSLTDLEILELPELSEPDKEWQKLLGISEKTNDVRVRSSAPTSKSLPSIPKSALPVEDSKRRRAFTLSSEKSILFSPEPLASMFDLGEVTRINNLEKEIEGIDREKQQHRDELVNLGKILENRIEMYKHDVKEREKMNQRRDEITNELAYLEKRRYETGLQLARACKKRRERGESDYWVRNR